MVAPILGISIAPGHVHAVVRRRNRISWAGSVEFRDHGDLAEVIARLAGECGARVRRTRIVLDRGAVQLRALDPAPPMAGRALRAHVALQASRLFRNGHGPLVTDARSIRAEDRRLVALTGAADVALTDALISGCEQAGLSLEALGAAREILPAALAKPARFGSIIVATPLGTEQLDVARGHAWRGRRIQVEAAPLPWHPALEALGPMAGEFAAAFAATMARPRLSLLSPTARRHRDVGAMRRIRRLGAIAAAIWLFAFVTWTLRLQLASRQATAELGRMAALLDSSSVLERELSIAGNAVALMERAGTDRSRHLQLLADLTRAVGDSVSLASLRLEEDGTLHLAGLAPVADAVAASLERMPGVRRVRFEAPSSRQRVTGQHHAELDRFAIVANRGAP